jgi:hypothetical protein
VKGETLHVGFTASPPFVVPGASDRKVTGVAIELLRKLAVNEGWKLELTELSAETLRTRLAACELDLGVDGVPATAALAEALELSQPYRSTVTTVIVKTDDETRAAPAAGHSGVGRLGHVVLRGLVYGAIALIGLVLASWLLNAFTGFPGGAPVRLRRLDATVSGPLAGLRWLARSPTGRVLIAAWVAAGVVVGVAGLFGGPPPILGDDPLRVLVERAAHSEVLIGERSPDGARVTCARTEMRDCFRSFADGTLAAIAGPRDLLCKHAGDLSLDDAVVRDDLAVPERFSYLLPPGSPLRSHLDLAMLRYFEHAPSDAWPRCPGDAR